MATEDTETEEGGQTDDAGDTGTEDTETEDTPVERPDKQDASGEKPSRTQRRANRFQEERNARARAEQELGELRGRYSGLEQQFNEFRQQIERDRQAAQQSDASNEARNRITNLRQQARSFLVRSASAKDEQTAQQLLDKHDQLMDEADDLRAQMRDDANWEKRRGELNQGPSAELIAEQSYFLGKYPWLESNVEAQKMIRARFESLVESGKRQPNRATMEEAVTGIGKLMGLGGRTNGVSDRSRQVYAGMGQRDGEMDDSAPSGSVSAEDVENSRAHRKLALLSYPDLEPKQAYAKYAKEIGSKALREANGVR